MTIQAYAKVNLTLEVFGKRPDGFHALRSVVLPIGLADTLTFTPTNEFSTDTGYANDLILKAAKILARENQVQPYRIAVDKHIPVGGGLGGGSADAAATLLALNELWQLGKTPEDLAAIGAQVGSDVPALVLANHYSAPVLMEGRGEVVSLLFSTTNCQLPTTNFFIVLINPGVPCSTAAVYGKCRARATDDDKIFHDMRTALGAQDIGKIAAAMMNDLLEPAIAVCPEVGAALAAMREAGVSGAMMSGSGSTVFGLVPTEGEGREIATLLNGRGLRAWSVSACPMG